MQTKDEKTSLHLNNLFLIYEDYVDSWKKNDFECVSAFLNNKNYKENIHLICKLTVNNCYYYCNNLDYCYHDYSL